MLSKYMATLYGVCFRCNEVQEWVVQARMESFTSWKTFEMYLMGCAMSTICQVRRLVWIQRCLLGKEEREESLVK